jgi:hypothetical protein
MYFRKAVLDRCLMSMIEKMEMPAMYIAIAVPLLIKCAPIWDQKVPSFVLPIFFSTPSWIMSKIMSEVILMILFPCFTSKTGEFVFVPIRKDPPNN